MRNRFSKVFRRWRLKKIHARFLESCRNLNDGRAYWDQASRFRRWVLETISPLPLLGLHEDGQRLLEALQWLEANCRERALQEEVVRHYHKLVFMKSSSEAGSYRKHDIEIERSAIRRKPGQKVPSGMKALDSWLRTCQEACDAMKPRDEERVLKLAVETHHKIGLIHPFVDANGRVARLAMNHLLRRYGLGYVIYPALSESPAFWDALQEAHNGRISSLLEFARTCVQQV